MLCNSCATLTVCQSYRGKYPFCNTFNSRWTEFPFTLPSVVSPLWDQLASPSVAPFTGRDDALSPLQWMSTHLHCCRTMQSSLADEFYFCLIHQKTHTNQLDLLATELKDLYMTDDRLEAVRRAASVQQTTCICTLNATTY